MGRDNSQVHARNVPSLPNSRTTSIDTQATGTLTQPPPRALDRERGLSGWTPAMSSNKGGGAMSSRDDWLATVEEDFDEDLDDSGRRRGVADRFVTKCWRLLTCLPCVNTFGLCAKNDGDRDPPEMETIKTLREAVLRTTSALSAPFLHMSAYLVRVTRTRASRLACTHKKEKKKKKKAQPYWQKARYTCIRGRRRCFFFLFPLLSSNLLRDESHVHPHTSLLSHLPPPPPLPPTTSPTHTPAAPIHHTPPSEKKKTDVLFV